MRFNLKEEGLGNLAFQKSQQALELERRYERGREKYRLSFFENKSFI
jgi:hypothetical protein